MGNFLSILKQAGDPVELSYLDSPSMKLREYYASFKLICDNFSIDTNEYSQIFGSNVTQFTIWNTQKTGRIDALELFSGLVLFSSADFQLKLQFLFEIFDLNEQGALSFESLQFMIINCCSATFKIYQINAIISDEDVELFLSNYFYSESSVKLKTLLKWTAREENIREFFRLIRKDVPELRKREFTRPSDLGLFQSQRKPFKKPLIDGVISNMTPEYGAYVKKLEELQLPVSKPTCSSFNPKMKWVYGIRTEDVSEPVKCITSCKDKAANEKLIYFIGKVAVVYYPKLSMQQHYTEHHQEISCLVISKNSVLAASGELSTKPNIHIWEVKTLSTVTILRNHHRTPISHLMFLKSDKLLISSSFREAQSSILVHSLEDETVLFSCYLTDTIVSILPLLALSTTETSNLSFGSENSSASSTLDNQDSSFIVICSLSAYYLVYSKHTFIKHFFNLNVNQLGDVVTAGVISVRGDCLIALTGHASGKVLKWTKFEFPEMLMNLNRKIISFTLIEKDIYLLTEAEIYQLNTSTFQFARKIAPPYQIFFGELIQLIPVGTKKAIVLSLMGDMIEINNINSSADPTFKKLAQVLRTESIRASCIADRQLYVASAYVVMKIDLTQNEMSGMYTFIKEKKEGKQIVCISVYQNKIAVGLADGQIIISSQGGKQENFTISSPPIDIIITKTHLLALTATALELFSVSSGLYFTKVHQQKQPKKMLIKESINAPLGLVTTSNEKLILISTQSGFLKTEFDLSYSLVTMDDLVPTETLFGKIQNNLCPFLYSPRLNFRITAEKSCVLFWNTFRPNGDSVICKLCRCFHKLEAHASRVSNILPYEQDGIGHFITIGSLDQMIIIWENSTQGEVQQQALDYPQLDEILLKQLNEQSPKLQELTKDSQIRIKNTVDKGIDKVIQQILVPDNPNQYQVQIDKTPGQQQLYMPPTTSLKLSYVFGFNSTHTRRSLLYCHVYPQGKKKVVRHQSKIKTVKEHLKVNNEIMNQIEYCREFLLPYTESHIDCRKYCVYFTDRICIRFDPESKQQRFYDSHRNAVTCIAVHPRKRIICSAEAPVSYMGQGWLVSLHFWDCKNLQTIQTFTIPKCLTIRSIQFSRDGKYLVSLSSDYYLYYIHIVDWQNNNLIAYRCLGNDVVLDVKFNPYKKTQIAVCGVNMLRIYQISCGTLTLTETAIHTKPEVLTCLVYISNSYGTVIQSDILTGNNHGDIGLFICGKYMTVKQKAHSAMINYLKVCELFKYKTILISAGEDQAVRIWDTKMELVNQINLRSLACMSSVHPGLDCSAQSIDIFHCDTESHSGNQSHTILLIGTRNGDILEAAIKNQYKGLKLFVDKKGAKPIKQQPEDSSEDYKEREVIHFKYSVQLRSYPSCSQVRIAVHKDKMITLSKTQQFLLWDLNSKQITHAFKTNGSPCVATFSHSGDILAVGYSTGEIDFYDVSEWNLHPFQRIVNGNYQVLNIVFSDSDSKLAVSLIPIKPSRQKIPMVSVFSSKSQPRKNISTVQRISKIINIYNQSVSNNSAAYFMNFSANQNEDYLLLWYQFIPSEVSTRDRQGKFFLWDLERNDVRKTLEGIQFNSINFSNAVNIKYNVQEDQQNDAEYADQYDKSDFVTDMTQSNSTIIMGTTNGQLVLAKSSCFYSEPQQSAAIWALGRCYYAHAGQISSLQIVNNELYTSGNASHAVMKWTILEDATLIEKKRQTSKTYEQILSKSRIDHLLLQTFPKRKNIFDVIENQDPHGKSSVDIKLRNIIGRNSLYKRNNLLCDFNNNIIMHAGCNLVMLKREQGQIKQQFLKVDTSEFSTLPQISVICLSDDRRILVVGTCSQNSKVIVWDINSRTCLSEIKFKDIIQIRCLRISRNNTNIIATCLTNKNILRLIYANLDLQKKRFNAVINFDYSSNTSILDIAFLSGQQNAFVTCGKEHMVQWRANCGLLTYENYKMDAESITIYCLALVKENLVSGSEDGYLYIWENKKIAKRQEAHPRQAILALYCSQDSRIFASGGTDGKVILWQLTSNILQKLYEYSVYEGPIISNITPTKYHIQSICISSTKLIAGTRSGDIYEFDRPVQAQSAQLQYKPPQLILPSFNHQQVISLRFSPSSKNIYVLTKAGTLSIIELDTLKKKYEYQIDMYDKELLKMFVCQITEIILLVFVDEVQVFDSFQRKEEQQRLASCRFNKISDAALSCNEKMLAVLLAPNQAENSKLLVYNLNIKTNRDRRLTLNEHNQTFTLYYTQENLSTNVDFIDFSTDNEYLVYKPEEESENIIIKLLTKERANSLYPQFHIEWAGQGKRTLDSIKAINSFYSEENQLLSLAQITDKCIIASDQMGSLRIFKYPVVQEQTYSKCYFEHLNNITICLASPDCRKLVTYSKVDRNINLWNVLFSPE